MPNIPSPKTVPPAVLAISVKWQLHRTQQKPSVSPWLLAFSHTLYSVYWQILSAVPSKYTQNSTTAHYHYHYYCGQDSITSCLNYGSSLITAPFASTLAPPQSHLNIAIRVILLKCKLYHTSSCLKHCSTALSSYLKEKIPSKVFIWTTGPIQPCLPHLSYSLLQPHWLPCCSSIKQYWFLP